VPPPRGPRGASLWHAVKATRANKLNAKINRESMIGRSTAAWDAADGELFFESAVAKNGVDTGALVPFVPLPSSCPPLPPSFARLAALLAARPGAEKWREFPNKRDSL
jgi:hypothetical protein